MKYPKNVQAVIEWYRQHRPDMVSTVENIFLSSLPTHQSLQALLLQGFEAGRVFERENPTVESGIGYLS